ncbi:two-component system response regulator KdpE [Xenorhabdus sp. 12]|uniref:Two-component system response regulator KdpE n=1 Tax=Xenorhabdus santafensis TaxID=2582833 RepID=A0ABU4SAC5_9GAMM|nr:two-component system response regulator KdpE [Xenorhabdus sp. 12]MDX7987758.1 two-component system response regulator KdpE [Xenorhabdus sp. 12]
MNTTKSSTNKNSTVLIIEDEKEIRRFVRLALESENWRVFECETLKRGLIEAATRRPDLLILDLGLPDGNGIELIQDIRQWSDIPIIVLSARDSEQDKVTALDLGADDYLSKPFGINELLARVRVALRHSSKTSQPAPIIHFADIQVDLINRRVLKGETELHLTPIEYRLLTELLANSGKVLTQRYLLNHVWGPHYIEHNHYLRIYMGHLRQKLEADPARPKYLLTETGVGYRFMPD